MHYKGIWIFRIRIQVRFLIQIVGADIKNSVYATTWPTNAQGDSKNAFSAYHEFIKRR